jgi:quinol monooxygenase YgiN
MMLDHTVFELRRYRLKPNSRETLIEVFDRELLESQEALGMGVLGQFRDIDDPDAFVWFRSFANMEARAVALQNFYSGHVWKEHGAAANATMVNSDNVLLLKPARAGSPFPNNRTVRPAATAKAKPSGFVVIHTCSLAPHSEDDFAKEFEQSARHLLEQAGARIDATFVTERQSNTFPKLPVREGETVFIWVTNFPDERSYAAHLDQMRSTPKWTEDIFPKLDGRMWQKVEVSRLVPTERSLLSW